MRELEVVLAIALTFLVFSSLISMLIEIIFRLINFRFKQLQVMLGDFYKHELSGLVNDQTELLKDRFVAHISKLNANNHSIDVAEFIERLATSNIAKEIGNRTQHEISLIINEFARRYDNYGKATSFVFKQRATKLNMLVAVIIALLFNVNLLTLTLTFLENRTLTNQLISQTPVFLKQAEAQQRELNSAFEQFDKVKQANNQQLIENVDALTNSVKSLNESINDVKSLGLPVGWTYYSPEVLASLIPNIMCKDQSSELCLQQDSNIYVLLSSLFWFVVTIVTGLLIGLGGPFWFDMVQRISAVRSIFVKPQANQSSDNENKSIELIHLSSIDVTRSDLTQLFITTYQANTLLNKLRKDPETIKPHIKDM